MAEPFDLAFMGDWGKDIPGFKILFDRIYQWAQFYNRNVILLKPFVARELTRLLSWFPTDRSKGPIGSDEMREVYRWAILGLMRRERRQFLRPWRRIVTHYAIQLPFRPRTILIGPGTGWQEIVVEQGERVADVLATLSNRDKESLTAVAIAGLRNYVLPDETPSGNAVVDITIAPMPQDAAVFNVITGMAQHPHQPYS